MNSSYSRRNFLRQSAAVALGFGGLRQLLIAAPQTASSAGAATGKFGPLIPDPAKIFDLPAGFSYVVIGKQGEEMDDGLVCPGATDGSASFAAPDGKILLIRNHELDPGKKFRRWSPFGPNNERLDAAWTQKLYDPGKGPNQIMGYGGTTSLLYNPKTKQAERLHLSLAGTQRNCAGGPMPWGSWLSCEETTVTPADTPGLDKAHGYNFEVPATATGAVNPVPLKAMGRFRHEAVACDPDSGLIYQTEDVGDGLIYRFLPHEPERLQRGGWLEALVVKGRPALDTRNRHEQVIKPGERLPVEWIRMANVDSDKDDLRLRGAAQGAAVFDRGEGMWYGNEAVYFACTSAGPKGLGQIWKLHLGNPQELELFIEPNDGSLVENADNLTVAPWGDLVLCEDNTKRATSPDQYLIGVTPAGACYRLGRNAQPSARGTYSEITGANFSPDEQTLFVNVMYPGCTLAITGPWEKARPPVA